MSLERNDEFFTQVLRMTKNGGHYIFPDESQVYKVCDGKFYGTLEAVKVLKKYTTEKFHHKICVE